MGRGPRRATWGSSNPPAAYYRYSPDRKGEHAHTLLATASGFLHADPDHPEHEETLTWCDGTLDPTRADLAALEGALDRLALRWVPRPRAAQKSKA